jgi:cell division protein FtsB
MKGERILRHGRNSRSFDCNGCPMTLVWKRIVTYVKCTLLFAAVAAMCVMAGENSWNQKNKLMEKKTLLHKENENLAMEIKSLERKVTLLRSDPRTIQKVAKKKLGMARPDETVYIFDKVVRSPAGAADLESTLDN